LPLVELRQAVELFPKRTELKANVLAMSKGAPRRRRTPSQVKVIDAIDFELLQIAGSMRSTAE
jgi:hypothetical protein